jgi:RHS repeat-associated protein
LVFKISVQENRLQAVILAACFYFGILYPAIANISWNVYGKIAAIQRNGTAENPVATIKYTYDASPAKPKAWGNRIGKAVWKLGDVLPTNTYYVRDASGNVMGIYESGQSTDYNLTQKELHLYGSSRLGILNTDVNVQGGNLLVNSQGLVTFTRGNKFFELSNHLGNVLVTISDKKIAHVNGGAVDYYTADVITANDYYPGGMVMPGRNYNAPSKRDYRYGFNGKENDNEVSGEGSKVDFGARVYDARIGRWFAMDVKTKPWITQYHYCSNNPVNKLDPDGKDDFIFHFVTTTRVVSYGIGVNKRTLTLTNTTASLEIIATNGPDRFYHHKNHTINNESAGTSEKAYPDKTTEFFPFSKGKTGITTSTTGSFGSRQTFKDDDNTTLMKYMAASPQLVNYIQARGLTGRDRDDNGWNNAGRHYEMNAFLDKAQKITSLCVDIALTFGPMLGALRATEFTTIYRSISEAEYQSIVSTKKLSFAEGQMEVKQFWLEESGVQNFAKTGWGNGYKLEIQVPKSLIGEGKALNTTTQVDIMLGKNATIDGAGALEKVNASIKNFKITKE